MTRKLAAERRELQQNLDIVNLDTSNIVVDTSTSTSTPSNVLISGSVIGSSAIGGATNFSSGFNFSGSGKKSKSFLGSTFSYLKEKISPSSSKSHSTNVGANPTNSIIFHDTSLNSPSASQAVSSPGNLNQDFTSRSEPNLGSEGRVTRLTDLSHKNQNPLPLFLTIMMILYLNRYHIIMIARKTRVILEDW